MSKQEKKKFKNWFDHSAALAWTERISAVYPEFDKECFVSLASHELESLEFMGRVQRFSQALAETLPKQIKDALEILTLSLPEPLPDCDSPTDGWLLWPMGQFIAEQGLDDYDSSMQAMVALTQRFTSEYAVRPFVERYPGQIFGDFLELSNHKSPHVRRWCSEGCRTRLPWGKVLKALVEDPAPIIPILESLKDDPELYVRRSVANNLNDLTKDHPELVVKLCKEWSQSSNPNRDWLIKHALRSLVKKAHPDALALLGFQKPDQLLSELSVSPKGIVLGESVELNLQLTNQSKGRQRVQVDYIVHYVRQKGKTTEKVFKWKSLDLESAESVVLVKKHAMKSTTIRALYSGEHRVEIQLNGVRLGEASFTFRAP